jgi:hypothetical protein
VVGCHLVPWFFGGQESAKRLQCDA